MSIDHLTALDLVATYMRRFGVGKHDLHGANPYAQGEFSARRKRVWSGIRILVIRGFAVTEDDGRTFRATKKCENYSARLNGSYANEYRQAIHILINSSLDYLRLASGINDNMKGSK